MNAGFFSEDGMIFGEANGEKSRDERGRLFDEIPARWSTLEVGTWCGGAVWRAASGGGVPVVPGGVWRRGRAIRVAVWVVRYCRVWESRRRRGA